MSGQRAVIYLRVSTKEQAEAGFDREGYSMPAQREACIHKAEQIGAAVVDEFIRQQVLASLRRLGIPIRSSDETQRRGRARGDEGQPWMRPRVPLPIDQPG